VGFNSQRASRLVFDIETCALNDAAQHVPRPDLSACRAPSNCKDPEKIAADIQRQRAELEADYAARLERCSLDWHLNRIVAIGTCVEGESEIGVTTIADETAEREALAAFWALADGRRLVGFYARSFDVPTLIQRSRYLDVPHPYVSLARYGKGDVIDLRDILTFDDARYEAIMPRSLTAFCERFGIRVPDQLTWRHRRSGQGRPLERRGRSRSG
jgi:predicted 3'-5' exonuclease similar to PolB exonuclease domain